MEGFFGPADACSPFRIVPGSLSFTNGRQLEDGTIELPSLQGGVATLLVEGPQLSDNFALCCGPAQEFDVYRCEIQTKEPVGNSTLRVTCSLGEGYHVEMRMSVWLDGAVRSRLSVDQSTVFHYPFVRIKPGTLRRVYPPTEPGSQLVALTVGFLIWLIGSIWLSNALQPRRTICLRRLRSRSKTCLIAPPWKCSTVRYARDTLKTNHEALPLAGPEEKPYMFKCALDLDQATDTLIVSPFPN